MATQINLKMQDDFYELAKKYADKKGYLSIQELVRDALRDKIYDNLDLSDEYKKVLESKEANTFLSEKETKDFHNKLKKKVGLN